MRSGLLTLLGLLVLSGLPSCASRPVTPPGGAASTPAASARGVDAFHFEPARVPVGRVIHYVKSNLDGSKPALVSVFFSSDARIDVYKSEEGLSDSAEVSAEMDWTTFSPRRLEAGVILADGTRQVRARVEVEADRRLHVKVGPEEQRLDAPALPFHIFNFDLMSLNVALPHLVAPESPFAVSFVEPTFGQRPGLVENRGQASFTFSTVESLHGVPCRKYLLSGPGMLEKGGALWVSTLDGLLELVETPLANNPDWDSFRLERHSEERMTSDAWERYRTTHVGAGVPPASGG